MKKTITEKEYGKLTHEVIEEIMSKSEDMTDNAKFAMLLTCTLAFSELLAKLFDSEEDEIEIIKEN